MPGNAVYRFQNTSVLAVTSVEAPIVVTSDEIDERLAPAYASMGVTGGLLAGLAGIQERRWWPEDVSFADAAALAGAKALAEAGVDAGRVGLLIDSSVSRANLEPSAAVDVHHQLALPPACLNFDLSNACLGFVNGMHLAGTMIDAGQIDYAIIVDGEGSRRPQELTIERLLRPGATRQDLMDNFATLTLGSGAAAMVLGRSDRHPEGHRFIGGVSRAATRHHRLCVGSMDGMTTDARGLLEAGVELSRETWTAAAEDFDWSNLDCYVIHQVSMVHTRAITDALGIDITRVPMTFPMFGNIGPASVPFTLAHAAADLTGGQRVGCLGIGSGLNAMAIEIAW